MAQHRLRRVEGLADGQRVNVPNAGDAVYSSASDGTLWVRKHVVNIGCESLLAEVIGWMLARRLGVTIPEAAVCMAKGEESFLSRVIAPVLHWSAPHAGNIVNMQSVAAMVVLDVLILNEDRHA